MNDQHNDRSDVTGFLEQVCDEARARVASAARRESLASLRTRVQGSAPPPSFAAALTQPGVAIIAEVKRASPSRGALAAIEDPVRLAGDYVAGGAAAVSILTEARHFHGDLADLQAVAAAVAVPTVRKDFVVDPYQVWEARTAGAAAVLLIVAALDTGLLSVLLDSVADAGLDALVEVHDVAELEAAVAARDHTERRRPLILGVNARDLRSLEVDTGTFARIRDSAPDDAILVAESGITHPDDVRRHAATGADAVLVGEHLVRAVDPADAVRRLVEAGRPSPLRRSHAS